MSSFKIGDEVKFTNYIRGDTISWSNFMHFKGTVHGNLCPPNNIGKIIDIMDDLYLVSYIGGDHGKEVRLPFIENQIQLLFEDDKVIESEDLNYLIELFKKNNIE